jgi:hypothetical protein
MDHSSKGELEQNLKEVEGKFQSATDALVQSYDEHMKKVVPKPKLLPIRISVIVECKNNLRIENVHVKPYDNLNDLLKMIEEVQAKKGDGIIDWNKQSLQFVLTGPLRNANINQSIFDVKMEDDDNNMQESLTQMVTISDFALPFAKFNIAAGSLITVKGQLMFDSDKPL